MLVQIRQAPTSSRILFYWNTISCSILRKLDGFILKQQIVFSRVKKAFALEQILFYRRRKLCLQKKKNSSSSLEEVFFFYRTRQYKPHKFTRGKFIQRARCSFLLLARQMKFSLLDEVFLFQRESFLNTKKYNRNARQGISHTY